MDIDMAPEIDTIVFDLGGVLVDWNPRHLYRKIFQDEREMEKFLSEVCNQAWNEQQDAGRPFTEAVSELSARHPHYEREIADYFSRWPEMLGGEIRGTAAILEELRNSGKYRIFALSNWSAETFPHAKSRYSFFSCFDGILLSGDEKLIKPDPEFFHLLTQRYQVTPHQAVFIDDVEKNVIAARALGFHAIQFQSPEALRHSLSEIKIL